MWIWTWKYEDTTLIHYLVLASVVVKIWSRPRWWHVSKLPRTSTKKFMTLRVHPGVSTTSSLHNIQPSSHPTFPKSSSVPKASSVRGRTPPLRSLHLPKVFPIPKVSNPKSEAQIISPPRSLPVVTQHHPPTLKTCNTPTLKRSVIHGSRFPSIKSWLISSSNHGRYNKSSTYRSCTYNYRPISPPRRHPCLTYVRSFFSKEKEIDHFPNPQNIHTRDQYTRSFPVLVHHSTTPAVLRASSITILAV